MSPFLCLAGGERGAAAAGRELVFPEGIDNKISCTIEHDGKLYFVATGFVGNKAYRVGKDGSGLELLATYPEGEMVVRCPVVTNDGYLWVSPDFGGIFRTNLATLETLHIHRNNLLVTDIEGRGNVVYFTEYDPFGERGGNSLYSLTATGGARRVMQMRSDVYLRAFAVCGENTFLSTYPDRGDGALWVGVGDFSGLQQVAATNNVLNNFDLRCFGDRVFWPEPTADDGNLLEVYDRSTGRTTILGQPARFFDLARFHFFDGYWYGQVEGTSTITRVDSVTENQMPDTFEIEGNAEPRVSAVDRDYLYYWAYVPNKLRSYLYREPRN
jgi:hypothetical protein